MVSKDNKKAVIYKILQILSEEKISNREAKNVLRITQDLFELLPISSSVEDLQDLTQSL